MKPLQQLLTRLGGQPRNSLRIFLLGLATFLVGVGLITLGYFTWPVVQLPGLGLLAVGGAIAACGYVGILANRLLLFVSR